MSSSSRRISEHEVTLETGEDIDSVFKIPVTKMDDGTACLILDPANITYEQIEFALNSVKPSNAAPLPLRSAWKHVAAAMKAVNDTCLLASGMPWYGPHARADVPFASNQPLHSAMQVPITDMPYPESADDPALALPGNGGVHAGVYQRDYELASLHTPTSQIMPWRSHGPSPSQLYEGGLELIYQVRETNVFMVDAGGVGECFFCAIAWQFDNLAPFKWLQYEREFGIKLAPSDPARIQLLCAIATLGLLRMLTDHRTFFLLHAVAFGLEHRSREVATFTALQGDDKAYASRVDAMISLDYPGARSAAENEKLRELLYQQARKENDEHLIEFIVRYIAPTPDILARFTGEIRHKVVSFEAYTKWCTEEVYRTPTTANIEEFAREKRQQGKTVPSNFADMVRALFATMKKSLAYLRNPKSYLSAPHVEASARGLGISIILSLRDKPEGGIRPQDVNKLESIIEVTGANYIATLILLESRRGNGGHYVAAIRRDEWWGQSFFLGEREMVRVYPQDFRNALAERYPDRFVTAWSFETDGHLAENYAAFRMRYGAPRGYSHKLQRARRILSEQQEQGSQSVEGLMKVLFESATFSYYQTPGPALLFARVFTAIMTHKPRGGRHSPMDHVRFVHRLISNLRAAGTITDKGPVSEITHQAITFSPLLGFDTGKHLLLYEVHFKDPVVFVPLRNLGNAVSHMLECAVAAAALAVLTYFCVPPPGGHEAHGKPLAMDTYDYLYDDDVNKKLTDAPPIVMGDVTKLPALFHSLARKSRMFGFQMTADMEPEVFLFARHYAMWRPRRAGYTAASAFFEHARILMQTLAHRAAEQQTAHPRTTIDVVPVQAQIGRGAATEMRFRSEGPAETEFVITLTVKQAFETDFTRRYHDQTSTRFIAWLTRAPTLQIASYRTDRPSTFANYLRHVQMTAADAGGISSSGSVRLVMRLERADIAAAQRNGPVFLHVAHMVLETSDTDPTQRLWVRSGHGFVNVAALNEKGVPVPLPLWEGPVESTFGWDAAAGFVVNHPMTFKRTHLLTLRVEDGPSRDLLAASVKGRAPPLETPNTLYTREEATALVSYVADVLRHVPSDAMGKHSLLYLNMPLDRVVVPNWTTLLLPPVGVSARLLEARVAGKLYDEAVTQGEFLQIAALAEDMRSPLQRYAWDRLVWILTQIINPFNKICYRFDRIDGRANDQMQFPLWGSGDCEDTAEGVVRFIRGLKLVPEAGLSPAAAVVARFLSRFEPAMTVMTTKGAKLGRTEGPGGLHMMAVLVPLAPPPWRGTQVLIPVETTGLSFNSYVTPDMLLTGAPEAERRAIIAATRAYTRICAAANRVSAAVKDERINYAVLVNAEGNESRTHGENFIRPHHFYCEFVMLMRPSHPGFYDFRAADGTIGVPFADVIRGVPSNWTLAPLNDAPTIARILPLVQRFADNVMPAPDLSGTSSSDELPTPPPPHPIQPEAPQALLAVRSVNFFIPTTMTSEAQRLIGELAEALSHAAGKDVARMEEVALVSVLGGAIEYYVLRVRLHRGAEDT